MKRKIVYLIDSLGMGGAERLTTQILTHISREVFEPRVCVLQQRNGNLIGEDLKKLDIPVDSLPVRRIRDISALPRLARYLKDNQVDLVHTQLEFSNVLGNISAHFMGVPGVSTIHVLPANELKLKRSLHQKLEALVLRNFCDRVIAVAEEARQQHIAATGARPSQVVTVYNGIDMRNFEKVDRPAARREVRQEMGIPADARVLMTVAVLRPEKGIDYMIRALPAILEKFPDTYYVVVGDGPRRDALLEEAANLSVGDRVIFTGMRNDIPRLLAAADLFVLPSLTEALPTVLIEAMAMHLPLVATNVGGVREMIEEGRNGRVVPSTDMPALASACLSLLSDPALLKTMGEQGRSIAHERFTIQGQVENLKEIYLEEIARHGR